jgi:hypothetical protein
MRISHDLSFGSALMRLMSAAPRLVAANWRSSATAWGRFRVITSSAAQSFAVGEALRVTEFLAFFSA